MARAQPVKVEGFQELMGGLGDSSMKHDPDENKMLSPPQQLYLFKELNEVTFQM